MEFQEFFNLKYMKTLKEISHLLTEGKMFFSFSSLSEWNELRLRVTSQSARASSGFSRRMG